MSDKRLDDGSCSCGCGSHEHDRGSEHVHDHGHAHDHDHGHAHDHDHEHHHHAPAFEDSFETAAALVSLEAHTHEQAATVSLDIHPKAGRAVAFADLICAMQAIAAEAEAAGGVVGHIKGYARTDDSFAHASVTASDLPPACEGDVDAVFGEGSTVQLVAIVLLISQDRLVDICRTPFA